MWGNLYTKIVVLDAQYKSRKSSGYGPVYFQFFDVVEYGATRSLVMGTKGGTLNDVSEIFAVASCL